MCGRNISKETSSTIGEQRRTNYALQPMDRRAFVDMMTTDLPPVPRYFSMDASINRSGAPALGALPAPASLAPEAVKELVAEGALLLDVRDAASFGTSHVPGSVNVGLGGQFASWAGSLVPGDARIVLVADDAEHVREAVVRLARVGLEGVVGFLDGGIAAWDAAGFEMLAVSQMPVSELRAQIDEGRPGLQILDVRRPAEYGAGHVPGAVNVPLGSADEAFSVLDPSKPTAVVCAGGYRSSAAASLLERQGFGDLYNVVGGTSAWVKAGYPTEGMKALRASVTKCLHPSHRVTANSTGSLERTSTPWSRMTMRSL
jgi:rhodanese-related sulfurtransferase